MTGRVLLLALVGVLCSTVGVRIAALAIRDGIVRKRIKKNARGEMATGPAAVWLGVLFVVLSVLPISGGVIALTACWLELSSR